MHTYLPLFEGNTVKCLAYIDSLIGGWRNPVDMCPKHTFISMYEPILTNSKNA